MDIELVTDPDACMMYIVSPLAGLGGAYCGGLPSTGCAVITCNTSFGDRSFAAAALQVWNSLRDSVGDYFM